MLKTMLFYIYYHFSLFHCLWSARLIDEIDKKIIVIYEYNMLRMRMDPCKQFAHLLFQEAE